MIDAMKRALHALKIAREVMKLEYNDSNAYSDEIADLRIAIEQAEKPTRNAADFLAEKQGPFRDPMVNILEFYKPEKEPMTTTESVCALLRQAHDTLSLASLPTKREWVGLTDEEILSAAEEVPITCIRQRDYDLHFAPIIEAKLKEKNGG